jgi:hypothetical protein
MAVPEFPFSTIVRQDRSFNRHFRVARTTPFIEDAKPESHTTLQIIWGQVCAPILSPESTI